MSKSTVQPRIEGGPQRPGWDHVAIEDLSPIGDNARSTLSSSALVLDRSARVERTSTNRAFLDPSYNGVDGPIFAVEVREATLGPDWRVNDVLTVIAVEAGTSGVRIAGKITVGEPDSVIIVERGDDLYLTFVGQTEPGDRMIGEVQHVRRDPVWFHEGREVLDGILEAARIAWIAFRAKHPAIPGDEFQRLPRDVWGPLEKRRADAIAATVEAAHIPTSQTALLALATDSRVWNTAAWNGEDTPGECITQCVKQLIYSVTDEIDGEGVGA